MRQFLRNLAAIPLLVLALVLFSGQAWSRSSIYVPESGSLFWLDILDKGDTYGQGDEVVESDFTLNADERRALSLGLEYWRLVLQDGAKNTAPLRILVLTVDEHDDDASAASEPLANEGAGGKTLLAGALADNWFGISGTGWKEPLA